MTRGPLLLAAGSVVLALCCWRRSGHQFHGSGKQARTGHWSERGHQEVAREIERFLDGRGWLP
jgi:hypothetical protein